MDEVLNRLRNAAKQHLDELQRWHSDDRHTAKLEVIADYLTALEGGAVRELPDPSIGQVLPPNDGDIQIGGMMSTVNAFDIDTDDELTAEEFENSPGALDEAHEGDLTDAEAEAIHAEEAPKSSKRKAKG